MGGLGKFADDAWLVLLLLFLQFLYYFVRSLIRNRKKDR